ncbi:MAG: hypothetical protein RMJ67_07525 [Elusimicrobiota bacterium]|nr:hypothetical protein [Endomicrobiia bacterium]MDW8166341.1 hypothetical protein [Elusimicrobiota bacterium]
MKKYFLIVISILVVLVAILISLGRTQEIQNVRWEYRVEYFSREDFSIFIKALTVKKINDLGKEGWEYAGPLCNDGINAQLILFKRPVK